MFENGEKRKERMKKMEIKKQLREWKQKETNWEGNSRGLRKSKEKETKKRKNKMEERRE